MEIEELGELIKPGKVLNISEKNQKLTNNEKSKLKYYLEIDEETGESEVIKSIKSKEIKLRKRRTRDLPYEREEIQIFITLKKNPKNQEIFVYSHFISSPTILELNPDFLQHIEIVNNNQNNYKKFQKNVLNHLWNLFELLKNQFRKTQIFMYSNTEKTNLIEFLMNISNFSKNEKLIEKANAIFLEIIDNSLAILGKDQPDLLHEYFKSNDPTNVSTQDASPTPVPSPVSASTSSSDNKKSQIYPPRIILIKKVIDQLFIVPTPGYTTFHSLYFHFFGIYFQFSRTYSIILPPTALLPLSLIPFFPYSLIRIAFSFLFLIPFPFPLPFPSLAFPPLLPSSPFPYSIIPSSVLLSPSTSSSLFPSPSIPTPLGSFPFP